MIVLDASALVDVILDQPTKAWVLEQMAEAAICAPAHQPAEVLSALARLVRAGAVDVSAAQDALQEARSLRQELVPPSATHLVRALDLQDRIRVLDGLYVVLAQDREATLVTTDERLASAQLPVAVLGPGGA